ncbi:DUF1592 domain-containing protein [Pseudohongiella spirulinae]|uniref:DUF1592 domain-containing protein n=1 Tax=Pseudohongiella spirulinae TaxID=1249552 RepID=A0A0S2KBI0_9GAMM|nr:DUF1592 domain-containing protein [Pseudohongiella spirulinae]ALO45642.1 hypothetical protein PS2015_973 [Pseudohongiella spirulinae]
MKTSILSWLARPLTFSLLASTALTAPSLAADTEANTATQPTDNTLVVATRRLSEAQYRQSIADIFGDDIVINARFEPERREQGLLALGSATLSMTAAGFEQFFSLSQDIAAQALTEARRDELMPCTPAANTDFDEACAATFINQYGELLFRRPVTPAELDARLTTAATGTRQTGDFHTGLQLALASLLTAPEFLFRMERAEPDPQQAGQWRLDAYTRAARLSFLFWNSTPDAALLAAARSGELFTEQGLQAQVERLSSSPRVEDGITAFLVDMMQIDGFDSMVKDASIYPKFNQLVADSAREQMVKTLVELLVTRERDYREIFTSNDTFLNRPLAAVYQVPFTSSEEWAPYTFPDSAERSGIFSQVGFLSQYAHPGSSSPTLRGIKLHEIFLCEHTPEPPADVDFSAVVDSDAATSRERLLDHMSNPGCIVCHQRSDPPGLALEHFDGLGQIRKYENGQLIDVSADLFGNKFVGAQGLGEFLYNDPRASSCLVRNVYAYGTARMPGGSQRAYINDQVAQFAENGHKVPALFKQIASTPAFFAVTLPEGLPSQPTQLASGSAAP